MARLKARLWSSSAGEGLSLALLEGLRARGWEPTWVDAREDTPDLGGVELLLLVPGDREELERALVVGRLPHEGALVLVTPDRGQVPGLLAANDQLDGALDPLEGRALAALLTALEEGRDPTALPGVWWRRRADAEGGPGGPPVEGALLATGGVGDAAADGGGGSLAVGAALGGAVAAAAVSGPEGGGEGLPPPPGGPERGAGGEGEGVEAPGAPSDRVPGEPTSGAAPESAAGEEGEGAAPAAPGVAPGVDLAGSERAEEGAPTPGARPPGGGSPPGEEPAAEAGQAARVQESPRGGGGDDPGGAAEGPADEGAQTEDEEADPERFADPRSAATPAAASQAPPADAGAGASLLEGEGAAAGGGEEGAGALPTQGGPSPAADEGPASRAEGGAGEEEARPGAAGGPSLSTDLPTTAEAVSEGSTAALDPSAAQADPESAEDEDEDEEMAVAPAVAPSAPGLPPDPGPFAAAAPDQGEVAADARGTEGEDSAAAPPPPPSDPATAIVTDGDDGAPSSPSASPSVRGVDLRAASAPTLLSTLVKLNFMAKGILLPTSFQPSLPVRFKPEDPLFALGDMASLATALFKSASPLAIHVQTAAKISRAFAAMIDDISRGIVLAWNLWTLSAKFNGVIINGPAGMLPPGGLVGGGAWAAALPLGAPYGALPTGARYAQTITEAIRQGFDAWSRGYTHPALPYPGGVACSTTMAPSPNAPVPLSSGSSPGDVMLSSAQLKVAMIGRHGAPGNHSEALFDAFAKAISTMFGLWKSSNLVLNVVGGGGVAPPPPLPPGPVAGASGAGGMILGVPAL